MRKIIFGLIIGLTISSMAYGYRISKPSKVTAFDDNNLVVVNQNFERLWDLTNGRYSPDSGSVASTGTGTVKMANGNNANSAGFIKMTLTNGTTAYIPYWLDETP